MFQENLFPINGKYEQNVFVDFMYTCEVQSSFNSPCFGFSYAVCSMLCIFNNKVFSSKNIFLFIMIWLGSRINIL